MIKEKNHNKKLGIVIPAYKASFFDKALKSIANQTNKDFTLYIGDDASPEELKSIVDKYTNEINIVYHRFSTNLGGRDLVSHWHRCIDLTDNEEWVWLFSDDDEMDEGCVEAFYNTLKSDSYFDLYRFDKALIDENSKLLRKNIQLPEVISSEVWLSERLNGNFHLTVVEFIFSRNKYEKEGRFQNFDMAYCSDDATWLKLSRDRGICLIKDAYVYWRKSSSNISMVKNRKTKYRHTLAGLEYVNWLKDYCKEYMSTINKEELNNLIFKWYTNSFYGSFMIISNYKLIVTLIRINKLTVRSFKVIFVMIKLLKQRNYNIIRSFFKQKLKFHSSILHSLYQLFCF